MLRRISTSARGVLFLFVLLLVGCGPSTPPPVRSSWSDQLAAIEQAFPELMGADSALIRGTAHPKRKPGESQGADEPIELRVFLEFQSQKPSQADTQGVPLCSTRSVVFSDYHLATTLASDIDEAFLKHRSGAPAISPRSIRLSAQDALQLTLAEGEAYMGEPVDGGNTEFFLRGLEDNSAEAKTHAVWEFAYLKDKDHALSILVDAQTGAILKRIEGQYPY